MSNRRIEMFEYRSIIYRLQKGETIRQIARDGLAGRKKISEIKTISEQKGWLNPTTNLPDEEQLLEIFHSIPEDTEQNRSLASPFQEQIEQWLIKGITAKRIHEYLVENHAFSGSYFSVQRLAQHFKRANVKLTVPLSFLPGQAAQVDFGQGPTLFDERVQREVKTWVFVMTLCWSRHQYAELVTHQDVETWLRCHQNAFIWFDGVPERIIIDNAKCAIIKACYYDPQVQRSYSAFAQAYGFIISPCPPHDPQKKGQVESGVKYIKRSFFSLRDFNGLQRSNQQLKRWVLEHAGNRKHGSVFEKPLTRFIETEKVVLKPLPKILPEIMTWHIVSLYRDCHVRFERCCYSAPYTLYKQELWLKSTPTQVTIYHNYQCVAQHARCFKPGTFSTQAEHLPPSARDYLQQDAQWCLDQSLIVGEHCRFIVENLLTDPVRDLLHQAQGLLKLRKTYGETRLELACKRAVVFQAMDFKTVRTILKSGLDYQPLTEQDAFTHLNAVYTGQARYQRPPQELLH